MAASNPEREAAYIPDLFGSTESGPTTDGTSGFFNRPKSRRGIEHDTKRVFALSRTNYTRETT